MEIVSFLFSLTFLLVPRPCGREREVIRMVREDKRNRKKKRETAYAQCVVSPTLLREREKDQELTVGEDTHLRFSGFTILSSSFSLTRPLTNIRKNIKLRKLLGQWGEREKKRESLPHSVTFL